MNRTERARFTLKALREAIPAPETELHYTNEYELLIAVILSAQCTDARVNKVTPALFEAFPDTPTLAQATPEDVYPYIQSVSYPNNKSKHLVGMAQRVEEAYDGRIPETLKDLTTLPGVGRKTAQVVASVAFDVAALPVDTHVFRVANRIGMVHKADTVVKVERQLKRVIPKEDWSEAHHLLILHGRYQCTARSPKCSTCSLQEACRYYTRLQKLPPPRDDLSASKGAYYCATEDRYFDEPATKIDRYDLEQLCCPSCASMQVYESRSGETTKQIPDYRV